MLVKMFTVFDSKAEAYLPPFFLNSTGLACRSFTETSNDPNSSICKYAADYTLFEIGTFDDQKGAITQIEPHNLGTALSYKTATPHHEG
jgi:hypothetical protein